MSVCVEAEAVLLLGSQAQLQRIRKRPGEAPERHAKLISLTSRNRGCVELGRPRLYTVHGVEVPRGM
jgi:hypothetical protein